MSPARVATTATVVLVVAAGVAAVVLGERDDSPGLQLVGVVLVALSVGYAVRSARR